MKYPSINQINGRIKNNQTIEFYKHLSEQRGNYSVSWSDQNYRNRSFNFNRYLDNGHCVKSNLSVTGNFTFGAAVKEFSRICKRDKAYSYETKYCDYDMEYGANKFSFTIRLIADFEKGICIEVQSYGCPFLTFVRHPVKSNQCFNSFDFLGYFEKKILPIYFFPDGLFRNIQLVYKLQKNDVAAKYKYLTQLWKKPTLIDEEETEIMQGKALQRRLYKKLKIKADDYMSIQKMAKALNTFKRQQKVTPLQVFPSPFALLESLSYDFDTEDEIMNEAENIIFDNTVLYI